VFIDKRIQSQLRNNAAREQRQIPGQNSVTKLYPGYTGGKNRFRILLRLNSGRAQDAQALLRHDYPRLRYTHP